MREWWVQDAAIIIILFEGVNKKMAMGKTKRQKLFWVGIAESLLIKL